MQRGKNAMKMSSECECGRLLTYTHRYMEYLNQCRVCFLGFVFNDFETVRNSVFWTWYELQDTRQFMGAVVLCSGQSWIIVRRERICVHNLSCQKKRQAHGYKLATKPQPYYHIKTLRITLNIKIWAISHFSPVTTGAALPNNSDACAPQLTTTNGGKPTSSLARLSRSQTQ